MLLALATFFYFRWSNQQAEHKTQQVINSLLRNESLITNSYALSKSILDLEKLGIVRCSDLIEDFAGRRVFYSTFNQNNCYQFKPLKKINEFTFDSRAVNGLNYKITIQLNMPWQSIILEFLVYLLFIFGAFSLNKYLKKQEEISLVRIKANEIEKQMFLDKTQQIRHDVASPIAAIKLYLDILTNIDPQIKKMISLSVERTQELFNQLNADTSVKLEQVLVLDTVRDIVAEKKLVVGNDADISFSSAVDVDICIFANKIELERLLSNLLNNAYEACHDKSLKKINVFLEENNKSIEIKIIDSGRGIPQHLIDKVGERGFSHGKEDHADAGSGLGLFHAITTVRSWGGDLSILSKENEGTTITINIPVLSFERKIKTKYDYILVEDDELVRMTWEFNAQSRKHNIKIFSNAKDLESNLGDIDLETIFYIDSNLGKDENGQEVKGEELAKRLFENGFSRLYLATGHHESAFSHLNFLKGVTTKEPPKVI